MLFYIYRKKVYYVIVDVCGKKQILTLKVLEEYAYMFHTDIHRITFYTSSLYDEICHVC